MFKIFTDGACSSKDNVGGWGFVVLSENDHQTETKSGAKAGTTNNEMELTAVLNALFWANNHKEEAVVIYSDSAYIVNCIHDKWYKRWQYNGWLTEKKTPVCNKELWKEIIAFLGENVTITKVKGHADSVGNNAADNLAVAARLKKSDEMSHVLSEEEYKNSLCKKS
jgi:ribonuclease HI